MPTNVTAMADSFNCPNYVGELFLVGQNKTPFLNMIGGLTGGRMATAFKFPISQEWNLNEGSQPAITEAASTTAPSPTTYVRGQTENTVQIYQKAVSVTYAKQSQAGALSGLNLANSSNPVDNELDFQINANLKQIAKDCEYAFINGVYQEATSNAVAAKSRGMLEAISTNVVDNGGTARALTKSIMKDLVGAMADNGSPFDNAVIFASTQKIREISELFENDFMEQDRHVGGVAIKQIIFDFVTCGIVWCPVMPDSTIMIADMAHIAPTFLPVPGKGFLFYEALAKVGAAETGQVYGQIGLDHGVEMFHGKITDLS